MAAFLDRVHIHRHAVAIHGIVDLARQIGLEREVRPSSRSRLIAAWHPGEGGRLVCRWSEDTADPA